LPLDLRGDLVDGGAEHLGCDDLVDVDTFGCSAPTGVEALRCGVLIGVEAREVRPDAGWLRICLSIDIWPSIGWGLRAPVLRTSAGRGETVTEDAEAIIRPALEIRRALALAERWMGFCGGVVA